VARSASSFAVTVRYVRVRDDGVDIGTGDSNFSSSGAATTFPTVTVKTRAAEAKNSSIVTGSCDGGVTRDAATTNNLVAVVTSAGCVLDGSRAGLVLDIQARLSTCLGFFVHVSCFASSTTVGLESAVAEFAELEALATGIIAGEVASTPITPGTNAINGAWSVIALLFLVVVVGMFAGIAFVSERPRDLECTAMETVAACFVAIRPACPPSTLAVNGAFDVLAARGFLLVLYCLACDAAEIGVSRNLEGLSLGTITTSHVAGTVVSPRTIAVNGAAAEVACLTFGSTRHCLAISTAVNSIRVNSVGTAVCA